MVRASSLTLRLLAAVTCLALAGCTADASRIALPPAGASFDYQLGGAYALAAGVDVVARDSTADPVPGMYNVCYVNGFQTQPGERSHWLAEHPDLVLHDDLGEPVVDPAWPDEFLLDISTAEKRDRIAALVGPVVASCATRGFDAVEIDNLDTWTRADERLTIEDAIALARAYATIAHDLGLAIAQKNGAEFSERLRDEVGFDFVVAEECARYHECADYVEGYGDLVFDIEYDAAFLDGACTAVGSAVLRDVGLVTPDDPRYVRATCA